MGCECLKNKEDKNLEIINEDEREDSQSSEEDEIPTNFIINNYLHESEEEDTDLLNQQENILDEETIKRSYSYRAISLINRIRNKPKEYIRIIKDNLKYIKTEYIKEVNKESYIEELKERTIFKKKVKVILNKGEKAFKNAIEILRGTNSMEKLEENRKILIPMPNSEEELKSKNFLKDKVDEIRHNYCINVYFKDHIKNPEVAILLMIVDDNPQSVGKKRSAILNPELKYIAVNSKFIGKKFMAYYSFSK